MEGKFWAGAKLVTFLTSVFYVASMNESIRNFDVFDAVLISVVFFLFFVRLAVSKSETHGGRIGYVDYIIRTILAHELSPISILDACISNGNLRWHC